MHQKLFSRDFTLVVIGQIISLFGNAAVRFVLPLYLLNQTGSSVLYGTVMACAFIPSILLSPVGGILADRVNKRNIMVLLDFITAAVITLFSVLMNTMSLTALLTIILMILYGIAGAYQPAVQASIPALVRPEHFMAANSVINMISSLASLLGPVIGGILYSVYGLKTVLCVCIPCFVGSAIMEIFIQIPFEKRPLGDGMWKTVQRDLAESIRLIRKEKPIIGKVLLVICGVNLFLASMLIVGLPYIITEILNFEASQANRLYGFAEGVLAAGGLMGGFCSGLFSDKFHIQKSGNLIIICAVSVFPMGAALMLAASGIVSYLAMVFGCFVIMAASTIFTVQMMSFVQSETPPELIGKVISLILTAAMCAQPLGNALYGILFEVCRGLEYAGVFFAGVVSLFIAVGTRKLFKMCGHHASD